MYELKTGTRSDQGLFLARIGGHGKTPMIHVTGANAARTNGDTALYMQNNA